MSYDVSKYLDFPDAWNEENWSDFDDDFTASVEKIYRLLCGKPAAVPTERGSIQLKWKTDQGRRLTLEFFSDGRMALFGNIEDCFIGKANEWGGFDYKGSKNVSNELLEEARRQICFRNRCAE